MTKSNFEMDLQTMITKAILLLIFTFSFSVKADIVDTPRFKVSGVVVVWAGDHLGNTMVSDLIIGGIDLLPQNPLPIVVGSLSSVPGLPLGETQVGYLDLTDAFAELNNTQSKTASLWQSSFLVASNTAFTIKAQLLSDGDSTNINADSIYRTLFVGRTGVEGDTKFGSAAQYPHSRNTDQAGVQNNGYLSNLTMQRTVFSGDRKTASADGTIAEQSVRFTSIYNTKESANSSEISSYVANVLYTVSIP